MKQKIHSTEEIIRILRQVDIGQSVPEVCRQHNISEASFYRWKKKFGDMYSMSGNKYGVRPLSTRS